MADQKETTVNDTAAPPPQQVASDGRGSHNTVDLDQISLTQALLDFEVANARVVDLTRRLTQLNQKLIQTTTELETLRLRNRIVEAELLAVQGSASYRSIRLAARVARVARTRMGR